jgi:hypothetical protein
VGRRGVNSSFKLFLPVFATHSGGGEGIRGLWCRLTETTIFSIRPYPTFLAAIFKPIGKLGYFPTRPN